MGVKKSFFSFSFSRIVESYDSMNDLDGTE